MNRAQAVEGRYATKRIFSLLLFFSHHHIALRNDHMKFTSRNLTSEKRRHGRCSKNNLLCVSHFFFFLLYNENVILYYYETFGYLSFTPAWISHDHFLQFVSIIIVCKRIVRRNVLLGHKNIPSLFLFLHEKCFHFFVLLFLSENSFLLSISSFVYL